MDITITLDRPVTLLECFSTGVNSQRLSKVRDVSSNLRFSFFNCIVMERVLLCVIEILSNNINNVSGETDVHSLLEDRKSDSCQLEIKADLQCKMKLEMHVERSANGVKSQFKGRDESKFKKKTKTSYFLHTLITRVSGGVLKRIF